MTSPAPTLLSGDERARLLEAARAAVRHELGLGPAPAPPAGGALDLPRGAFVTLAVGGEVRGSVGVLAPEGPLGATVARLAGRAAAFDPRFPPLAASEAEALEVRVAAVGPVRPLAGAAALRLGAEGVSVTQGWHRAVLLPSAAAGKDWDAGAFLKHACLAAGLGARAHQEPDAVLEAFEAEEFGA